MNLNKPINRIKIVGKWILTVLGALTLLFVFLAFTSLPFWGIYRLSLPEQAAKTKQQSGYIICMSGSGFPGKSTLLNLFYTAQLANDSPKAQVIVAFPAATGENQETIENIRNELITKGIDSSKITFATQGTNTRGQALDIRNTILHSNTDAQVTLVTTPEHTYRTYHVFKKLNFKRISTYATFENDMQTPLIYSSHDLDGNRFIPDVGENQKLRYQLWTHMKYEITLLREYTAIVYYKLQGWI
ncbi:MAG: YdcF family protein [Salinivirgaceae bacterium]|jgi:uncharacterized SAM-binding protein YcdF (DUF218 family)|nr:YdcF family protein [Salinivirgaceae bacterium]